jgi:quercetin dioxygenase-like cupin family protein
MRLVKSKGLWVLLAVFSAVSLFAGTVLATPQVDVVTTILAKSLFGEIDVKARAPAADDGKPCTHHGDRDDDKSHRHHHDVWEASLKTEGLSDVYVVDNEIAPGGTTGWHTHPGPSLINVVSGTITNYRGDDPTCTGEQYTAGQGFIDSGSDVHMLRNEGSVPVETIAVQLLPKDAVRRIDVTPAPGNCPF